MEKQQKQSFISSLGKVERERDEILAVSKDFYSSFLFDHNDGFGTLSNNCLIFELSSPFSRQDNCRVSDTRLWSLSPSIYTA